MTIRECLPRLTAIGISLNDAEELRRISMTLHRWHELECGDGNDYASWTIARGRKEMVGGEIEFIEDDNGKTYLEWHNHHGPVKATYKPIPDRETGAKLRLRKIMGRYPELTAYVQTDPRGASLYILQAKDIPNGGDVSSCYSRGIAVYK